MLAEQLRVYSACPLEPGLPESTQRMERTDKGCLTSTGMPVCVQGKQIILNIVKIKKKKKKRGSSKMAGSAGKGSCYASQVT